jgi:hypothetical protein
LQWINKFRRVKRKEKAVTAREAKAKIKTKSPKECLYSS